MLPAANVSAVFLAELLRAWGHRSCSRNSRWFGVWLGSFTSTSYKCIYSCSHRTFPAEKIARFRSFPRQSYQPYLPLPVQLLLVPSCFLTFKCPAKSLCEWGTLTTERRNVLASQSAWSRHGDSHSLCWLCTALQTGKEVRRAPCC